MVENYLAARSVLQTGQKNKQEGSVFTEPSSLYKNVRYRNLCLWHHTDCVALAKKRVDESSRQSYHQHTDSVRARCKMS